MLQQRISRKAVSIAAFDDSDLKMPELGKANVFVRRQKNSAILIYQEGRHNISVDLEVGKPTVAGPFSWLLAIAAPREKNTNITEGMRQPHLTSVLSWLNQPMRDHQEVKSALKEFLQLSVKETSAINGMLVTAESEGFRLLSVYGMHESDATAVWNKMPKEISETILRNKARVLLPEGLKERVAGKGTVFIKDMRQLAGFPLIAEGRILAILYLGFNNLVSDLSESLQESLERSCDIAALVIQRAFLREQVESLSLTKTEPDGLPPRRLMLGESESICNVYNIVTRLAPVAVPTLILGETGTGKELCARELHRLSPRKNMPFIAVNAAAIPENLFEAELFGYRRGAFTGAFSDHTGYIEQAQGGTLFIDEVGDLPAAVQTKLLRVLQERTVTRIGDTDPKHVDFRLITATHRNLESLVAERRFRDDLYYRIAGALLQMPALRERRDDINLLANYFRQKFVSFHGLPDREFSSEVHILLEQHAWPGNIRELENVVNRACVMSDGHFIESKDLEIHGPGETKVRRVSAKPEPLEPLANAKSIWMKDYISKALSLHQGNRTKTARSLAIGERTLFRYLEQFNIRDQ